MIDTIHQQNLKSLLNSVESTIDTCIRYTFTDKHGKELLDAMNSSLSSISSHFEEIGNYSADVLKATSSPNAEILPAYIIHFIWMEDAKSYLILWRDVIFQYQKSLVLKSNGDISASVMDTFVNNTHKTIVSASEELKQRLENEISSLVIDTASLSNNINDWKKRNLPWETYKKQFGQIRKQGDELLKDAKALLDVVDIYQTIQRQVEQNLGACQSQLEQLNVLAQESIQYIKENTEEKPGKIAIHFEDLESKIETPNYLKILNDNIDAQIELLPGNIRTALGTQGGTLLYQDINYKRKSQQWLDAEILPLVYEVWELDTQVVYSFKMALINIRNRAVLLSNDLKEGKEVEIDSNEFSNPIISFLQKGESWKGELRRLIQLIFERLRTEFLLSEIYNDKKEFLPVTLQSTINQFRLNENPLVLNIKTWIEKQWNAFQNFISSVEQEESLSISEKLVRYIQSKKTNNNNQQYSGIFLTKGYVGKSFWIGRENDLQRFSHIVDQWKLGYRGAVILSGQRFSGKSLFGGYVSSAHFHNKTIQIIPNSVLKLKGRSMQTTYDLGAALEFVRKHTINSQMLIWIDDLEKWNDPNITLSQNVRALNSAIDNFGNRMFFMVSMGNWTMSFLDKTHEILKVFQAEINLDRMSAEEIKQAILIRHGATHKTLINEEEEELSPQDFQKIINRIFRATDGNIGEVLNQWANGIFNVDEERVSFKNSINYSFPDFINADNALLLSALMMEKRSNEYRLRKLFGPSFKEKYQHLIQRMISVGILKRHLNGWLEINELVVNDVGRLLEEKHYLKFNR